MEIFDAAGRLVHRLSGTVSGGQATLTWDGRDRNGHSLASGVFFARVAEVPEPVMTRMTLVK